MPSLHSIRHTKEVNPNEKLAIFDGRKLIRMTLMIACFHFKARIQNYFFSRILSETLQRPEMCANRTRSKYFLEFRKHFIVPAIVPSLHELTLFWLFRIQFNLRNNYFVSRF